jgi:uncharacterized protein YjdB
MLSRALAITAVVACELLTACDIQRRPVTGPGGTRVEAVFVVPDTVVLDPLQAYQFSVFGRSAAGDSVVASVSWTASAGTITEDALFTADSSENDAVITATLNGTPTIKATARVRKRKIVAIVLTPASVTLPAGGVQQFTARGVQNTGDTVAVSVRYTATGGAVTSGGLYTAGSTAGSYRVIAARAQGPPLADTAAVTITSIPVASVAVSPASASVPVGQTVQLTATPTDANGNPLTGRVMTWVSSAPAVATVSASGRVTAKAAGSATITATSEGKSGTAAITVTLAPVASVTVSPAPASVTVGQTVQLTATPKDANGNSLTGRVVTWTTSDAAVATVSASGLVSGLVVGTATITATSEEKSGNSVVTVGAAGLGCAAACRYVAVNGNDGNPGTSAAPWRTIQHAADVANPGDTVIVNDGIYTGGANVVTISRSGTAAAWLVFRAAHRWAAVIDGQTYSSAMGFSINGNYIRVEGFEVRHTSRVGIEPYGGREDIAGNHDIVVAQNHVHDIGHICTGSSGGIVGIAAYSDNLIIERNVIHDIGRLGPGEQGCVPPNAYWQNHDHGIYNGVGNNVVIRNNVFYNFTHGWAIQRYNGAGSVTTGLTIVNNTFGFPNPWRDGQIIIGTTTNNVVVANNIFYQPTTAGVWFDGAGNGATLVGNVSTNAVQTLGTGLTMSGNMPNTDPLFVNATAFNFHPAAGSPARGLGVATWCPLVDFDGLARTGACSAGAFQN